MGESVWEEINQCFDRLPLSAVIDHDIFCIHGGIPRPVADHENAIQAILSMPNVAAVNPCYEHETDVTQQVMISPPMVTIRIDCFRLYLE